MFSLHVTVKSMYKEMLFKHGATLVVYSHLSPSHLLLSMGTNSLDMLSKINPIENKGG